MKALANSATCPKCGTGHKSKPFCLYENGWYCFACGYTKASDRSFSLHDRRETIPNFPQDITMNSREFSIEAWQWLSKYNIFIDDIFRYNIWYSAIDNSLVFPIKNGEGKNVGYQKRGMLDRKITISGKKSPTILKAEHYKYRLIIVEDYISAIRVSKDCDVVCLWGTKCSYEDLENWFKLYDVILVWLDNDKEKQTNSGQEAAKKIIEMSEKCMHICDKKRGWTYNSKQAINIVTEKDPKCYYDIEIQQIVRSALNGY